MAKLTKRTIQAIKTKNIIYDAFRELIKEVGFEGLTIEKICKKAKVSVGTFYHHYKTKNDIMEETFQRADEHFQESIADNHIDGKTAGEKILHFFELFAQFQIHNGVDFTKAIYNTHNKLFVSGDRLMAIVLKKIVIQGINDNQLSDEMSPQEITRMLFTVARGVVFEWCIKDGGFSLDKVMKKYILILISTLEMGDHKNDQLSVHQNARPLTV